MGGYWDYEDNETEDIDEIEDIYSKGSREKQLDEDELTAEEEAFMRGWDAA